MKTSHTILLDLLPGQATTDAIAEHLQQPRTVIAGFLQDLETDGLVSPRKITSGFLTVWSLTTAGHEVADSLNQPATA